jgi:hypothetical protein
MLIYIFSHFFLRFPLVNNINYLEQIGHSSLLSDLCNTYSCWFYYLLQTLFPLQCPFDKLPLSIWKKDKVINVINKVIESIDFTNTLEMLENPKSIDIIFSIHNSIDKRKLAAISINSYSNKKNTYFYCLEIPKKKKKNSWKILKFDICLLNAHH